MVGENECHFLFLSLASLALPSVSISANTERELMTPLYCKYTPLLFKTSHILPDSVNVVGAMCHLK